MKIQYCSDLHLEFRENKTFLAKNPIQPSGEILLLAGDVNPFTLIDKHNDFFDFVSANYDSVFWVPGNHEYYHYDLGNVKTPLYEKIRENAFLENNQILSVQKCKSYFEVELHDSIFDSNAAYWIYGHHHNNTPEFAIGNTIMLTEARNST